MQSVLQYRRIGLSVHAQLDRDAEKAKALTSSRTTAPGTLAINHNLNTSHIEDDTSGILDQDSYPPEDTQLNTLETTRTRYSERTALGYSLTGVDARARATNETEAGHVFVVGWEGDHDPQMPQNWSFSRRILATVVVGLIAIAGTAASSIDAAVLPQYSAYWGVSEVAGTLATAMYLFGFAIGSQFAGPFSETLGRNIVYIVTMLVYMLFLMGCGLAPTYGGHITLRFLAGIFASSPLTVAGGELVEPSVMFVQHADNYSGTIADLWNALEKTYAFSLYAFVGFSGPLLGPVIASFIGQSGLSWYVTKFSILDSTPLQHNMLTTSRRWCEWLMLVLAGIVLVIIILAQPETYAPLLLSWRAAHFRAITGDDRYRSALEVRRTTFLTRLRIAVYRPFVMIWTEPIILLMSLYLTILYIVLFTFFVAFSYVFTDTYGISQGLTNIIWLAVFVGFWPLGIVLPVVWRWTLNDLKKQSKATGTNIIAPRPETRLWFAMLGGAFAVPISKLTTACVAHPWPLANAIQVYSGW